MSFDIQSARAAAQGPFIMRESEALATLLIQACQELERTQLLKYGQPLRVRCAFCNAVFRDFTDFEEHLPPAGPDFAVANHRAANAIAQRI